MLISKIRIDITNTNIPNVSLNFDTIILHETHLKYLYKSTYLFSLFFDKYILATLMLLLAIGYYLIFVYEIPTREIMCIQCT